MGFWNSVIYITTSWRAVTRLPEQILPIFLPASIIVSLGLVGEKRAGRFRFEDGLGDGSVDEARSGRRSRKRSGGSVSDSMKGLAG